MLDTNKAFSSFSVNDLQKAKHFYGETLGVKVKESPEGLELHPGQQSIFIYPKPNHKPATFTVLNFQVNDIARHECAAQTVSPATIFAECVPRSDAGEGARAPSGEKFVSRYIDFLAKSLHPDQYATRHAWYASA